MSFVRWWGLGGAEVGWEGLWRWRWRRRWRHLEPRDRGGAERGGVSRQGLVRHHMKHAIGGTLHRLELTHDKDGPRPIPLGSIPRDLVPISGMHSRGRFVSLSGGVY